MAKNKKTSHDGRFEIYMTLYYITNTTKMINTSLHKRKKLKCDVVLMTCTFVVRSLVRCYLPLDFK
ncbi:hypothetical protein HanXRQr2_Chr08g0346721 [Helianthus annuus]|uniref:Uncharacterized protein n=1 Tax=Helianthus annuus TaxID=4232 RepID=A0A9K3IGS2_HELAN|nr:hypothetical protein HanXRQr2_Chr08g0346721 [Helianthus annuus]